MLVRTIRGIAGRYKSLVDATANVIECEYEYSRPLRFAVREKPKGVVRVLLEKGADAALDERVKSLVTHSRVIGGHADWLVPGITQTCREISHACRGGEVGRAIKARDCGQKCRRTLEKTAQFLACGPDERGKEPQSIVTVMTRRAELNRLPS
jgi:hypothetical protein